MAGPALPPPAGPASSAQTAAAGPAIATSPGAVTGAPVPVRPRVAHGAQGVSVPGPACSSLVIPGCGQAAAGRAGDGRR
jgi:hypothetical protein